jgi:hypothetical protein
MKWIAFAALDVYIGLIILEALISSLPPEKVAGAKRARVVMIAFLGMLAIAFVGLLIKRWI